MLSQIYDAPGPIAPLGPNGVWSSRPETDAWRDGLNALIDDAAAQLDDEFPHLRTPDLDGQTHLLMQMSAVTTAPPLPMVLAAGAQPVDLASDLSRVLRNEIQLEENFQDLYVRQLNRMLNDVVFRSFAGPHAAQYIPVDIPNVSLTNMACEFLGDSGRAFWSAPARAIAIEALPAQTQRLRDCLLSI